MAKLTISSSSAESTSQEIAGLKNLIALYHKRIGIIENIIKEGGDGDESPVYAEMQLQDMKARLEKDSARLAELEKAA